MLGVTTPYHKSIMSQQPNARSNLIQMLLIFALVFLGMQLFFPKSPQQSLTTAELIARYKNAWKETQMASRLYMEKLQGEEAERLKEIHRQLETLPQAYAPEAQTTQPPELAPKPTDPIETLKKYFHDSLSRLLQTSSELAARLQNESKENPRLATPASRVKYEHARLLLIKAEIDRDFNTAVSAYQAFRSLATGSHPPEILKEAKEYQDISRDIAAHMARFEASGPAHLGYLIIDALVKMTGSIPGFSYWFAAIVLAVVARLLVWPLAAKQIRSFKRMAQLQPMVKELQENYQGAELQQRIMKLYQKYDINPWAGCLPSLVQIPFFLWIFYSMNLYRFEFQKGTFLWINPSTANAFHGIAPNLGFRDYPLVIIYGISMIVATLLSVSDPQQAQKQRIIGLIMAVVFTTLMLFWDFPSAFVLYWIGLNIVSTAQTIYMNKQPVPPLVEVPAGAKKNGLFKGLIPSEGTPTQETKQKTGTPVLHKPKTKKHKKKK